ncbi:type II toxin-antitoxin system RelE family toxin [Geminocystis herdmanii]|uniref:type II toxin-antitoxin system RelE family toxin n=1 Tax=Geminocystis herdmanii TaxID=669359 RepID=UPI000346CFD8|nr:type II toxin-antitoxin system RelE/ParE family toxin [Geminocystis herdmanii]
MKTEYLPSFIKDLKKLKSNPIYNKIKTLAMIEIPNSENLTTIDNVKKIKGDDNAYRIRVGDYRIGFFLEEDKIIFSRVLHRKEIYRFFP